MLLWEDEEPLGGGTSLEEVDDLLPVSPSYTAFQSQLFTILLPPRKWRTGSWCSLSVEPLAVMVIADLHGGLYHG